MIKKLDIYAYNYVNKINFVFRDWFKKYDNIYFK